MSKLGLGRAKLASSVLPAFGEEPPDKKRKRDESVAVDSAWDDDDLDILLTQNMNKLDSLVASTQSAAQRGCDESATNCNDRSHHSNNMDSVQPRESEEKHSVTGTPTVSLVGKRLVGHGSSQSRSADCLNNSSAGGSVQTARKNSFSSDRSCSGGNEPDRRPSWTSFQCKSTAGSSSDSRNIVKNLHTTDTAPTSALPMRLDANANHTETKLTRITEECEYYKAEVCLLLALVCMVSTKQCCLLLLCCCLKCTTSRQPMSNLLDRGAFYSVIATYYIESQKLINF